MRPAPIPRCGPLSLPPRLIVTWAGSLVEHGAGASGLLYRRNRYYDPASGRFTQQDPIGLGGGLNVYGFAGGDPVNYSDPFGLSCEPKPECERGTTLVLGGTGLLGVGQAIGVSAGIAIDSRGSAAVFGSVLVGAGVGATAGLGGGLQRGALSSLAGGHSLETSSYENEQATTLTVALGPVQATGTLAGRGQNGTGSGLGLSARPLGVGAGAFLTQSRTYTSRATPRMLERAAQAWEQFKRDATRAMTCPRGCTP